MTDILGEGTLIDVWECRDQMIRDHRSTLASKCEPRPNWEMGEFKCDFTDF